MARFRLSFVRDITANLDSIAEDVESQGYLKEALAIDRISDKLDGRCALSDDPKTWCAMALGPHQLLSPNKEKVKNFIKVNKDKIVRDIETKLDKFLKSLSDNYYRDKIFKIEYEGSIGNGVIHFNSPRMPLTLPMTDFTPNEKALLLSKEGERLWNNETEEIEEIIENKYRKAGWKHVALFIELEDKKLGFECNFSHAMRKDVFDQYEVNDITFHDMLEKNEKAVGLGGQ